MDPRELGFLRAIADGDDIARLVYADWLQDQPGRDTEATRQRQLSGFIRKVEFSPAWDRRHPDPNRNYGIHGVDLRMVLIGPAGATQFLLFTNWHLPHVAAELFGGVMASEDPETVFGALLAPSAADLGYHAKQPQYEGQSVMDDHCLYTGGPCYYDGSSLNAEPVLETLIREGDEAVWQHLLEYYRQTFVE